MTSCRGLSTKKVTQVTTVSTLLAGKVRELHPLVKNMLQ